MMPFLAALAAIVLMATVIRWQFAAVTIHEYERGLRFDRGRLRGELESGRHWYVRSRTSIRVFDLRATQVAVNGQEVLSKDGVAVKVSVSATYRVVAPRTAVMAATDYTVALYTELQQALRAAVSAYDVEALLASRAELGPALLARGRVAAERLGLELEQVVVRDLTLPGELKKLFAQVVKARQDGLAALERARGETAALRHLANAAAMVGRTPELLELRALQVASQQPGTTLVLGVAGGAGLAGRRGPAAASPESDGPNV
jgi:regulator of protease activity HflC (stomatin/prohibitin superfamily)